MPLTRTDLFRKRSPPQSSQAFSLYLALGLLAEGPADHGFGPSALGSKDSPTGLQGFPLRAEAGGRSQIINTPLDSPSIDLQAEGPADHVWSLFRAIS